MLQGDEEIDQRDSKKNKPKTSGIFSGSVLGLKPQQLFILLLMFLVMVCLLGSLLLLVTGKMVSPFHIT